MKPKFNTWDLVASKHNPGYAFRIMDILVGKTEIFYYDIQYNIYSEKVLVKVI